MYIVYNNISQCRPIRGKFSKLNFKSEWIGSEWLRGKTDFQNCINGGIIIYIELFLIPKREKKNTEIILPLPHL